MEPMAANITPEQYAESAREHFTNSFPGHLSKMRLVFLFHLFVGLFILLIVLISAIQFKYALLHYQNR